MRKYENQCVGCPSELGCIGEACRYINTSIDVCDQCSGENAKYRIDGEDYCESCAKEYLQEIFDGLTTLEKSEVLDVDIQII